MSDYTRRSFVLMSLALLAGCAGEQSMIIPPSTDWETGKNRTDGGGGDDINTRWTRNTSTTHGPVSNESPSSAAGRVSSAAYALPAGVLSRAKWATGDPIPSRMNPMTQIFRITVHHDGMAPFWESSESASKARLDSIRRGHLSRHWGDIGYHYIVDRAGRVWEGRPLPYQGAHVKYHNPGNIGVMCMGNFDRQSPTIAQLDALNRHVAMLVRRHHVVVKNLFTHQELRPTACPGKSLQRHMVTVRHNGLLT